MSEIIICHLVGRRCSSIQSTLHLVIMTHTVAKLHPWSSVKGNMKILLRNMDPEDITVMLPYGLQVVLYTVFKSGVCNKQYCKCVCVFLLLLFYRETFCEMDLHPVCVQQWQICHPVSCTWVLTIPSDFRLNRSPHTKCTVPPKILT